MTKMSGSDGSNMLNRPKHRDFCSESLMVSIWTMPPHGLSFALFYDGLSFI